MNELSEFAEEENNYKDEEDIAEDEGRVGSLLWRTILLQRGSRGTGNEASSRWTGRGMITQSGFSSVS